MKWYKHEADMLTFLKRFISILWGKLMSTSPPLSDQFIVYNGTNMQVGSILMSDRWTNLIMSIDFIIFILLLLVITNRSTRNTINSWCESARCQGR